MVRIRDYEVTVPPTSGEVEALVLDALRTRSQVGVTMRAVADDLNRNPVRTRDVEFSINQMRRHEDDGMTILGRTVTSEMVNLHLAPEPELPATVSIVTSD